MIKSENIKILDKKGKENFYKMTIHGNKVIAALTLLSYREI